MAIVLFRYINNSLQTLNFYPNFFRVLKFQKLSRILESLVLMPITEYPIYIPYQLYRILYIIHIKRLSTHLHLILRYCV